MYIGPISKIRKEGRVYLEADITIRNRKKRLYFAYQTEFEDYLCIDGSAFLAAMLLASMAIKEDVQMDGSVSVRLYRSLKNIGALLDSWGTSFKSGEVRVTATVPDSGNPKGVGLFFSGGVDSFYTYLKNKKNNPKEIDHFIFVHGFDIPLSDTKLFRTSVQNIQKIAEVEGIKLITVETNLRDIIDPYVEWSWAHGSALASIALMLRRCLGTVYIASSNTWDELFPYGCHPDLDPLWSTESLRIIHDGNEAKRLQKVELISSHHLVKKYLRVCYDNLAGAYNCGECSKCLRTMVELRIAGTLDQTESFNTDINISLLQRQENNPANKRHFGDAREVMAARGIYPDLIAAIDSALSGSRPMDFPGRVRYLIGEMDKRFFRGRIMYHLYWGRRRLLNLF